jgi:hypothetical protein
LLSSRRRRGDVFFGHVSIGPGTAQVEKLYFENSNHLDFGRKAATLKYSLMAMIVPLFLVVVTSVGVKLTFVRVTGRRRGE